MKRVIVTGAQGFLGRHVLGPLVEKGFEVYAFDRESTQSSERAVYNHTVDLFDECAVVKLFSSLKPSHLLHLAWYVNHQDYLYSTKNVEWAQQSLMLLDVFRRYGGKRVLVTGTCLEYKSDFEIHSELKSVYKPGSLYAKSKNFLHRKLAQKCASEGISFAWAHIFFLFGPGQNVGPFVPAMINGLLDEKSVECKNPALVRDYLYVKDVAGALAAFLDSPIEGSCNIGSGDGRSLGSITNTIFTLMGHKEKKFPVFSERMDDYPIVADIAKLKNEIIWSHRYTFNEALLETIEFYRQKKLKGGYESNT